MYHGVRCCGIHEPSGAAGCAYIDGSPIDAGRAREDGVCGTRCLLLVRDRADDHAHEAAIQNGLLVAGADLLGILEKLLQDVATNGHMAHLAPAELHDHSDLVARGKELLSLVHLGLVIMRVDAAGELDLLKLYRLLLLLGFLLSLLLFKAELAVVHDLAHGGRGLGGDHDQIQFFLVRDLESLLGAHDPQGFSVGSDDPDLLQIDVLVQERLGFFSIRGDR